MGTPEFAVESLKILVENNYEVVAVVTMPDKPAGRGHKLQYSAIKEYALEKNLKILQPEKLKDEGFLAELSVLKADIQVVVAFRMLPEIVWNMPRLGTFNLHASLLPQYRGAAPINWAIINGDKQTGATTFFLTHEIDTGKIILQEKIDILPTDNAGTVHDKLMVLGAELVRKTIDIINDNQVNAQDQNNHINTDTVLKSAPKIFKETCEINLHQSVNEVHNFVRGMSPHPTAWTSILLPGQTEKTILKIYETDFEVINHSFEMGELIIEEKKTAKIALKDGFLYLKTIQAPGKKRMGIAEFLRGLR
jgi:methionyl-tRNA formyltransferase